VADGAERVARAALSAIIEPGDARILAAVADMGATTVLVHLRDGDQRLDPGARLVAKACTVDGARILGEADQRGVTFVVPGDDRWPDGMDGLRAVVRDGVGRAPCGLWCRGGPLSTGPAVAIVGSRAATVYGVQVAADLACAVAHAGVAVVSGAAYGVDAAAHRGALAGGGSTVAVLAGGPDVPYPRGHASLLERIVAEGGVIASEVPPGSGVTRRRFLARNRLVAAWAHGTVVVEAGLRSGARSTVSWSHELGRPVGAVPGPVTSAMSQLPHRLLRDQEACLVADGRDVLQAILPIGAVHDAPGPEQPGLWDDIVGDVATVGAAFPARGDITLADVVASTGLPVTTVLHALEQLTARTVIASSSPGRWRLTGAGRRPAPQAWR
jgi:DNA processing protein